MPTFLYSPFSKGGGALAEGDFIYGHRFLNPRPIGHSPWKGENLFKKYKKSKKDKLPPSIPPSDQVQSL